MLGTLKRFSAYMSLNGKIQYNINLNNATKLPCSSLEIDACTSGSIFDSCDRKPVQRKQNRN